METTTSRIWSWFRRARAGNAWRTRRRSARLSLSAARLECRDELASIATAMTAHDAPAWPKATLHGSPAQAVNSLLPSVTTQYYQVQGTTKQELTASLHQFAPTIGGQRYAAITNWHVDYRYFYAHVGGDYSISSFTIAFTAIRIFPQWNPPVDASMRTVRQWAAFIRHLNTHEQEHLENGYAASFAVGKELENFPPAPTAASLAANVATTLDSIVNMYSAKDNNYDRVTDHRATQGAVWPPR